MKRKTFTAAEAQELRQICEVSIRGHRRLTHYEMKFCERMLAINAEQYEEIHNRVLNTVREELRKAYTI